MKLIEPKGRTEDKRALPKSRSPEEAADRGINEGGEEGRIGPEKTPGRPQEAKTLANQGKGRGKAGKAGHIAIKVERLPDGRTKRILKDKATGRIIEKIE